MKDLKRQKETIYALLSDEAYVPMRAKEIAILLNIPKERREELHLVLDELISDGKIEITKKGRYQRTEKQYKIGSFISHKNGYGFVEVEGEEEDYFIPEKYVHHAFLGDTVKIELSMNQRGKRREGKIIEILDHEIATVIGTYQKHKTYGFVLSDQTKITQDIFIPQGKDLGAVTGHKVVCQITNYGDERHAPEGCIVEILGHENDPGVDILSIIKGYDVPIEFSDAVLAQATRVAKDVSEADRSGRLDLRDVPMVTIDGEDAKDLDDAISICRTADGYELGVHIADVTNYVQENSALDKEARRRGTSIYLLDRVIPMLPHTLSNGICSLNEGQDRLALSCIMKLDEKGRVYDHIIAETVVCIDRRMSYTSVKKILSDADAEEIEKYKDFVPMFRLMEELSQKLQVVRKKRGAIDFDFPEAKLILDASGKPVDVISCERNVANRLIEDFMLLANETVAQHFFWQQIPFLYRVHGQPDPEKIQKLMRITASFGHTMKGSKENIHPKEIQKLLTEISGTKEEDFIARLTLRSMQHAVYQMEPAGHFGLAAEYYCHFTSPIRRYPDLQIHRIIKENLRHRYDDKRRLHYESLLPLVAKSSSEAEKRAEELEREVEKLKKVEYLSQFIGERFSGVISGVTSWGLYVELPNSIEGLVHISSLVGDYYEFHEETYELVGKRKNKHYALGQDVDVIVTSCDTDARTIDFILAENADES